MSLRFEKLSSPGTTVIESEANSEDYIRVWNVLLKQEDVKYLKLPKATLDSIFVGCKGQ